jgi:hypothetical protein
MAPSGSDRMLNGRPVVLIGVDRRGDGRDNGARWRLPHASEQEEDRDVEEDVSSVGHGRSAELQPPRGL